MNKQTYKKVAIGAAIILALALISGMGYNTYQAQQLADQQALELIKQQEQEKMIADQKAKEEKQKELDAFAQKQIEEMKRKAEAEKAAEGQKPLEKGDTPAPPKDKVTEDQNGNVDITPDYSKPEPPAPPVIPEDQKKDPSSKPEYKPEDVTPSKPSPSTPGGTNNEGKIYVPGFGWVPDPGSGTGTVIVADDMIPNGNIIGK